MEEAPINPMIEKPQLHAQRAASLLSETGAKVDQSCRRRLCGCKRAHVKAWGRIEASIWPWELYV